MAPTTAPTATVTPRAATVPGALDGFLITCTECGPVVAYSLETLANGEARSHERWHASKAVARKAARR